MDQSRIAVVDAAHVNSRFLKCLVTEHSKRAPGGKYEWARLDNGLNRALVTWLVERPPVLAKLDRTLRVATVPL